MDAKTYAELPAAYTAEYDQLGNDIAAFATRRGRALRWWAVACGGAAVTAVAVGTALILSSGDASPYLTPLLVTLNTLLFVYLFGNLPIVFRGHAEHRRKELRREKMNADAPAIARACRQRDDQSYSNDSMTTRQAQHAWYGSHSELNWRDRELARSMGLDADTYVSNVLERE